MRLHQDWVATSGWDNVVRLWRRDTLELLAECAVPEEGFTRLWELRRSPDGRHLCTRLDQGRRSLRALFPIESGRPVLRDPKIVPAFDYLPSGGTYTHRSRAEDTRLASAGWRGGPGWSIDVQGFLRSSVPEPGRLVLLIQRQDWSCVVQERAPLGRAAARDPSEPPGVPA